MSTIALYQHVARYYATILISTKLLDVFRLITNATMHFTLITLYFHKIKAAVVIRLTSVILLSRRSCDPVQISNCNNKV